MVRPLIYEFKCKCGKYFLYSLRDGPDFRCYGCKSNTTLEDVEKELREMSEEEYQSFMQDIEEYERDGE